jgi:hypothetical protein
VVGGGNTIHFGHTNVHQGYIDMVLVGQRYELNTIMRLPNNCEIGDLLQEEPIACRNSSLSSTMATRMGTISAFLQNS